MNELVSVVIPAYNDANRIPIALASLISQDYENWEVIVVDDGSTDDTLSIIRRCNDSRIQLYRFEENRGRPQAREHGLRNANGAFLAMLDADDWWYPEKLFKQMKIFDKNPSLALVSAGMAITDEEDRIVGVRALGTRHEKWPQHAVMARPSVPAVAHAPSVIRMEHAQRAAYDDNLPVAEDVDFLIKILNGNEYTVLPEPLYAYSEMMSVNPQGILTANQCVRQVLLKYLRRSRFWIAKQIVLNYVKGIYYRVSFSAGLQDWVVRRRSRRPTLSECRDFDAARDVVYRKVREIWPQFSATG